MRQGVPQVTITCSEDGDSCRLAVAGELDLATAPQLVGWLSRLIRSGRRVLELDLHDVSFTDGAGLRAIRFGCDLCAGSAVELRLVAPASPSRLFELTAFLETLPQVPMRSLDSRVAGKVETPFELGAIRV